MAIQYSDKRKNHTISQISLLPSQKLKGRMIKYRIIGESQQMRKVNEIIEKVSHSNVPVLVTGEIGSGKELVARNIHYNGINYNKPFVAISCAAIPKKFLESSIFGYNGTIFFEEIGDLELPLQSKLLRVIQEKEFELYEDSKKGKSKFRLISSTSNDLGNEIKVGTFRRDLFNMISVVQIDIPPLRSRKDDIPLLAAYFLNETCIKEGKALSIRDEVMETFMHHPWPGNVRQLRNVLERAVVLASGNTITKKELPKEFLNMEEQAEYFSKMTLKDLELQAIRNILQECRGNKSKASRMLGISRKAFYKRLREYNLL